MGRPAGPGGIEEAAARLRTHLELDEGPSLVFLFAADPLSGAALRRSLRDGDGGSSPFLLLRPSSPEELRDLLPELFVPDREEIPLWVEELPGLEHDEAAWLEAWRWLLLRLNERRDRLLRSLRAPLVLVLPRALRAELPALAPDLWSVRAFSRELPPPPVPPSEPPRRGDFPEDGWFAPEDWWLGPAPDLELAREQELHLRRLLERAEREAPERLPGLRRRVAENELKLARALQHEGRPEEALRRLERALPELDGAPALDARLLRASLLGQLGRDAEGLRQLQEAAPLRGPLPLAEPPAIRLRQAVLLLSLASHEADTVQLRALARALALLRPEAQADGRLGLLGLAPLHLKLAWLFYKAGPERSFHSHRFRYARHHLLRALDSLDRRVPLGGSRVRAGSSPRRALDVLIQRLAEKRPAASEESTDLLLEVLLSAATLAGVLGLYGHANLLAMEVLLRAALNCRGRATEPGCPSRDDFIEAAEILGWLSGIFLEVSPGDAIRHLLASLWLVGRLSRSGD